MPPVQDFCIKLSMSNLEGRPLSVTLARFHEFNNPLIGCSREFLHLTGRARNDVIGQNCRFLNQGLDMATSVRERLHHTIRTGAPFMGILKNKRYLGNGCWDVFENALHIVVVFAGVRSYILGIQVNVTGLNLNLTEGSPDAARLQLMFDSVLSPDPESFINGQECEFQSAPLYLYIRHAADNNDQVQIVEEQTQGAEGPVQQVPNQYLVLAPQFMPLGDVRDKLEDAMPTRWVDELLNDAEPDEVYADAPYAMRRTPSPPMHCESEYERTIQYKTRMGNFQGQADVQASYEYKTGMGNALGQAAVQASHEYKTGTGNGPGQAAVRAQAEDAATEAPDDESFTRQSSPSDTISYSSKGCLGAQTTFSPLPLSKYRSQEHDQAVEGIVTPTMKTQLRALDLEDPETVIIARGISKLGLTAGETLKHYFARFGTVKAVHIPHTFKKRKRCKHAADADASAREIRAPGRCFVVMSSPDERIRILAHATQHLVHNVKVSLEAFNAKPYTEEVPEADEEAP